MEFVVIALAFVVFCLLAFVVQGRFLRTPKLDAAEDLEPAFTGSVDFGSLSLERVSALRPFVDRAGLISYGERGPHRNEGNSPIFTFEIYVLDTNGVTHTVAVVEGHDNAAAVARKVASMFEVPLDDPDFVTAGR